ncbi:hypothetical protein C6I20_14915 [Aeromicrobium sp. A1-2]|nr:hypothetical protein C6I20_14915 [Aeromicrobium sp. A1-2]
MTHGLDLAGTVVTLFGDRDRLDTALCREFGRRGGSTHNVTASTGWLSSAIVTVLRLDTESGYEALAQLVAADLPRSHVVAVCAEKSDPGAARQIDDLCRSCGDRHDFSLIWHPASAIAVPPIELDETTTDPMRDLAATIADEVQIHAAPGRLARYETRTFDPTASDH